MDLAEMERRLIRLEDIEAIKQLKARYCEICDDDHNPDRITSVFAEDGIWESAEFGTGRGHAEIRTLFQSFQELIEFSQHNVMNPIIEVHGDRATGNGTSWAVQVSRRPSGEMDRASVQDDYVNSTASGSTSI
jgi:hypothetical protein